MNRRFQGRHPRARGKNHAHSLRGGGFWQKKRTFSCKKDYDKPRSNDLQEAIGTNVKIRLREKDVGITEYISKHEGFCGVIKQRFSDFHVNEIDSDGKIVTLTDIKPPPVEAENSGNKKEAEDHLKSVVTSEVLVKINNLITEPEGSSSVIQIEVTEMSKDDRRIVHSAIKSIGGGKLVSNTKQKEEKKFIEVLRHNSKDKSDRRGTWPAGRAGDYVYFILYKENMDTMETVNLIASKLRIKPNMINYAGTKDRRGITTQMMSIWRVEPRTLANLNSSLRGITLGNYTFKQKGLKLGDLKGNRFRIVLRNVTGSDEQIKQAMTSLSENGFLNYYGLQRFGSSVSVPTHEIGKALLQGNWKLAVELILKPRDGEQNNDLIKARRIWWETRDATKALKVLFNKEKLIEGKLLLGLSQCGANDYVTALEKIPRNTRLLYLHSYQSVIWNNILSRRIREFGLQPVAGDLVFASDALADITDMLTENEECDDTEESSDRNSRKNAVRVLTEEDLANVNIQDIVMPLPGHDVTYPQNVMKDWYEELLKLDGLSSASLKQSVRAYSVSGAYRKIVIQPDKLSWKSVQYSDPHKILELSDVERMKNVEVAKCDPDGKYKALVLDFCLPSSTYATMALREILKSDTSSQHQAQLSNYHLDKQSDSSPVESGSKVHGSDNSTSVEKKDEKQTAPEGKDSATVEQQKAKSEEPSSSSEMPKGVKNIKNEADSTSSERILPDALESSGAGETDKEMGKEAAEEAKAGEEDSLRESSSMDIEKKESEEKGHKRKASDTEEAQEKKVKLSTG